MTDLVAYPLHVVVDITDGPDWKLHVEIDDEADDNAADTTAQWQAEEFDVDDLFGSTGFRAKVVVTLNGETREMTGEEFFNLDMADTLSDDAEISVTFADRAPA